MPAVRRTAATSTCPTRLPPRSAAGSGSRTRPTPAVSRTWPARPAPASPWAAPARARAPARVLLFGADHAVTQDAIFGDVPHELLEQFGLFTVQTRVTNQDEYLLRPDLGRQLDDESRTVVAERCVKKPQVQIVVGDGLSAAAVTNNLPQIYPVIEQGLQSAGLSLGHAVLRALLPGRRHERPQRHHPGRRGAAADRRAARPGRRRRAERLLRLASRARASPTRTAT